MYCLMVSDGETKCNFVLISHAQLRVSRSILIFEAYVGVLWLEKRAVGAPLRPRLLRYGRLQQRWGSHRSRYSQK